MCNDNITVLVHQYGYVVNDCMFVLMATKFSWPDLWAVLSETTKAVADGRPVSSETSVTTYVNRSCRG